MGSSLKDMKTIAWMGGIFFSLALVLDYSGAQEPLFEGLAFLHGFNHGAAIRSFQQSAELDPECAMPPSPGNMR
jgi:hypothetical protein